MEYGDADSLEVRLTDVFLELGEEPEHAAAVRRYASRLANHNGDSLPNSDSGKIAYSLAIHLRDRDVAALDAFFRSRIPSEQLVARSIREKVVNAHETESLYDVRVFVNTMSELVDEMSHYLGKDSEKLFACELEFHAVAADFAEKPLLARMIREIKTEPFLKAQYDFDDAEVQHIAGDHSLLLDRMVDFKTTEKQLDDEVERHVMLGLACDSLKIRASESAKLKRHRKEAIDMDKESHDDKLADYYKVRIADLLGGSEETIFRKLKELLNDRLREPWLKRTPR